MPIPKSIIGVLIEKAGLVVLLEVGYYFEGRPAVDAATKAFLTIKIRCNL